MWSRMWSTSFLHSDHQFPLKQEKSLKTNGFQGFLRGGDKRDRTADLLNAIAPEVLDSVEVALKVRQNRTKWTFNSPYRFNWCMAFRTVSGTNSGTKISAESKISADIRNTPKNQLKG